MTALTVEQARERIERHAFPEPNSGCHLWNGTMGNGGYGVMMPFSGTTLAHRVAYMVKVGPIPDGMTVHHTCFNPPCVNVDHMEIVTQSENSRLRNPARARPVTPRSGLTVEVPRSLLTEMDRVAGAAGISRSDFVRMALAEGMPLVASRLKVRPA